MSSHKPETIHSLKAKKKRAEARKLGRKNEVSQSKRSVEELLEGVEKNAKEVDNGQGNHG